MRVARSSGAAPSASARQSGWRGPSGAPAGEHLLEAGARPGPSRSSSKAMTWRSAGRSLADRLDLLELGCGRDQHRHGAGVAQDVLDLSGGEGGVDRHVGAAGGEAGVVGDGPLGPVLREDRHPVAAADAQLAAGRGSGPGPARPARGSSSSTQRPSRLDPRAPPAGSPNRSIALEVELVQRARRGGLLLEQDDEALPRARARARRACGWRGPARWRCPAEPAPVARLSDVADGAVRAGRERVARDAAGQQHDRRRRRGTGQVIV